PEDGIRGFHVTGVQTCALPISRTGSSWIPYGSDGTKKGPARAVKSSSAVRSPPATSRPRVVPARFLLRGAGTPVTPSPAAHEDRGSGRGGPPPRWTA